MLFDGYRRLSVLLIAMSTTIAVPQIGFADDWPTFRGSQRTSIAADKSLLATWPDAGPELVWEASNAGKGYASVAIAGDKIFTLGDGLSASKDPDEFLSCFNRKTGEQLWTTKTGPAWKEMQPDWHSSRSTPTVDGNMVYIITPKGVLFACNTGDGKVLWQKNLVAEMGGKKDDPWGYSESVLIDGNKLVCTPGGDKATMVALDKTTGEEIWRSARAGDIGAGHASIVISEVGSTRVYVQTTGSGAIGVSPKDGKVLWSYPIPKTTAVIPTPIVRGDLVFFSVGYGRGGALLQQIAGPNGDVTIKEIYGLNPKLANKHGGVILIGDYLYGDSDDKGTPFCADLMTGDVKWKGRGPGSGSTAIIGGAGMLYMQFQDGVLALVKADPSEYKVISQFKLPSSGGRPVWAHPVILDGQMFVRSDDKIFCYNVKP